MTDEQLLDLRLCDLPLKIEHTLLARRAVRLYEELEARGLRFKPHVWLSEEWFTPDRVPGFAIPFYLAHPRLAKLERRQMLEVEGGTEKECMRIMRHEAGHAIDNAFQLHRRPRYRELFGSFRHPYPDWYKPEPNSRNYVLHLPAWYAQAHPAEDFAETFAVWLTSGARWRKQYAGWRAIRKLEYVDMVMGELAGRAPANRSREKVEDLREIEKTLREHYRQKRRHYDFQWPPDYDRDLLRIFSSEPRHKSCPGAVSFLRRYRRELCNEVGEGTGVHIYAIDQMLGQMINRCRELKLRVGLKPEHARQKVLVLLTVQTMSGIHTGYHRIAL
ncbi:MAG TPA: putative zinc-binding metallopeptidase [Blastocatellia bacterium]|nr:putative zinc-binding metallopeptidase [Blastocatellia bacterium]